LARKKHETGNGEGYRSRVEQVEVEPSLPFRGRWLDTATKEDLMRVLETAPCGIFVVQNHLGESLYINPEVLKISGYDLADIPTGRVARKALFTDKKTRRQQARFHEEMMADPNHPPFLSRIVRKDGSVTICEVRCVSQSDGLMVGVWTDVTRREVAEEELRIREARFRSLFEDSFDAVLLLEHGIIIDCNQAALAMFRCSRKEGLLGRSLSGLADEDGRGSSAIGKIEPITLNIFRKKKVRIEHMLRRMDGEHFPTEITAIGIRLQNKDVHHVMIRDLTALKEAQSALIMAKEKLEERVRERTAELTEVNKELKKSREELRLLSEHLQRESEEGRKKVAREVHDEFGQLLTVLKMDVVYTEQHLGRYASESLRDRLRVMGSQIDSGINTVRKICADMRPHVLERLGLVSGIEWYLKGFGKRTGIECRLSIEIDVPDPGKERSLVLFRVLQEAMTNVVRHAQATVVVVELKMKSDTIVMKIRDNGCGITREQVENLGSFGILGMRERIRFWGGRSSFRGSPASGTSITIWLPLSSSMKHGPGSTTVEDLEKVRQK
jgi:PAS domain S-box-containing protein